ncbi:hypothetical protein [Nocardia panacis]|uniref:hypothetical protein n=1 Tax=Nocardia panacis TaxID=2340916 RepID=UPI00193AD7CB|nr:hypothetical protein [Nocardia panacis]
MSSIRKFTPTGWVAVFNGTDALNGRTLEVDGWEAGTGAALVVDTETGIRRPVTEFADFTRLERTDQVVAALPGAGWRVRSTFWGRGDRPAVEEVLTWLVGADGRVTPVAVDEKGSFGEAVRAQWCYPPGAEVTD